MRDQNLGPTVDPVTRELRYTSYSALEKFDVEREGGCWRRYWFRYVAGIKEPETASMKEGTALHAQLEHYLVTGQDVLGKITQPGKHLLPAPGSVIVEAPLSPTLLLGGVRLVGFIDVQNESGWYVDLDGVLKQDPPNTVEVLDHKTTSNVMWAKPGEGLINTIQMPIYGMDVIQRRPETEWVRLSHIYYQTRGTPQAVKRTALVSVASIADRWDKIALLIPQVQEVVKRTSVEEVSIDCKHEGACFSYNRRCPNESNCYKGDAYGGMRIAAAVDSQRRSRNKPHGSSHGGTNTMALTDKVRALLSGGPTAVQAAPQPAAPAPVPTAPAPVAAAPTPVAKRMPIGVEVATCDIGAHYIIDGVAMDGEFTGTSKNKGFFKTAQGDMMLDVTAIVMSVPKAAPAPAPSPAASPAPVPQTAPTLVAPVASAPIAQAAAPAPAGAPVAVATPPWASGGALVVGGAPAPAPEAPKATRKKRTTAAPADAAVAAVQEGGDDLCLYVDCIPNAPFVMLDQYVHETATGLAKAHGLNDLRAPTNDSHPAAFGRWKGILAEGVRAAPPAPGVYVVFAKESEIAQVVVEALASFCVAPGTITRGR